MAFDICRSMVVGVAGIGRGLPSRRWRLGQVAAVVAVCVVTGAGLGGCDALGAAGQAALAAAVDASDAAPSDSSTAGGGSGGGVGGCVPQCVGKQCGADGCGGSCGTCNTGKSCVDSLCSVVDAGSCVGRCGEYTEKASCQCDAYCVEAGDCCTDHAKLCSDDSSAAGCGSVPEAGVCDGSSKVRYCLQASGSEDPAVITVLCEAFEACGTDSDGWASCQTKSGSCQPGAATCAGPDEQQLCSEAGVWQTLPCEACAPGSIGVSCGTASALTSEVTVHYEFRSMNNAATGWGPIVTAPLPDALLLTAVPDGAGALEVVASATTDGEGRATVAIPAGKTTEAVLVLVAVKTAGQGAAADFEVVMMRPEVPDGTVAIHAVTKNKAKVWNWKVAAANVLGGTWTITEAQLSGVLRVFDYARYAHSVAAAQFGKQGPSLGIWMRPNTAWSCGACFTAFPHTVGAVNLKSHIWIPMTAKDNSYWSDAVNAHELGHWVMEAFGKSPGEGGTHFLHCATFPGQAWSEGFATWVSSAIRGNPIYFDSQGGSFFWFDIGTQKTNTGKAFPVPVADSGWLQYQSENWVAGTLWALTNPGELGNSAFSSADNQFLLTALASKRMTQAPFGRGYTRHTWEVSGAKCGFTDVENTGKSAPMLADFLDAVVCADADQSDLIEAAVGSYPYPVGKPICK